MAIYGFAGVGNDKQLIDLLHTPCVICNGYINTKDDTPDLYAPTVMKSHEREYYTCVHRTCWDKLTDEQRDDVKAIMLHAISLDCDLKHNVQKFGTIQ